MTWRGKPSAIFNMDETGVPFEPRPPKCVFSRGARQPAIISSGNKGQFTVVGCVNAAGFLFTTDGNCRQEKPFHQQSHKEKLMEQYTPLHQMVG